MEIKDLHAAMEVAHKTMSEDIKRIQDVAEKAREEVRQEGTLHAKTNEELKKLGESTQEASKTIKGLIERVLDVEQKLAHKPVSGGNGAKSHGQLVIESEQFKAATKNISAGRMEAVEVPSFHKTAISGPANDTTGDLNALVVADRRAGIVTPGLRRMTIRSLLAQRTTSSNAVDWVKENVFTNNAGPQYDATSPAPQTEGAPKNESGITFTLNQSAVVTLAHWVPASRQILADAQGLAGYIDGRLRYGLMLEEEDEMLNSSGTSGELNGINNQATAFSGGVTNATALDTLLRAFTQVSLSEFDATGVILHPTDWQNILLLKDTTGRYLFADPHGMENPMVWGKDVIATQSQTLGTFTAGNFLLGAEVVDRETASVRVAEQHADFFTRNMVVILAEERLALIVLRPAAIVKGAISHAG